MKSYLFTIILTFLTLTFFAQKKNVTKPIKIGVISIQEIIAKMPEAKSADSSLKKFQLELEDAYADVLAELKEKDSLFRIDSSKWTQTVKDLKRNDLQRLYQQLQTWQQTAEESLQRKQQELLVPLRTKALGAIEKVAKENGYTQIIEKSITYFTENQNADITPLVEKELSSN